MTLVPERVVVINLERRTDRRVAFDRQWDAAGWAEVLPEPDVFSAVEGFEGLSRSAAAGLVSEGMSAGAYGCWMSHITVLDQALRDGVASVMVLEDDAVLATQSPSWLGQVLSALPGTADALWLDAARLGASNRLLPGTFGTARILRPPMRTHGYILTAALIEVLLPVLSAAPAHIDRHFAWAPMQGVSLFAAVPALATQLADRDALADSDTGARMTPLQPGERAGRHGSKDALRLRRLSPRA